MSQYALARTRRSRSTEPTLRLLAFQLRHQWFCVPLAMTRRVLPMQTMDDGRDVELVQLQDEAIPVLNTARLVYGGDALSLPPAIATQSQSSDAPQPSLQSLVVTELSSNGSSVALMVDGTPALKRVFQKAFQPVPPIYQNLHKLRGLSSLVNPDPNSPNTFSQPMFLLNIEALLQQGDRQIQAG